MESWLQNPERSHFNIKLQAYQNSRVGARKRYLSIFEVLPLGEIWTSVSPQQRAGLRVWVNQKKKRMWSTGNRGSKSEGRGREVLGISIITGSQRNSQESNSKIKGYGKGSIKKRRLEKLDYLMWLNIWKILMIGDLPDLLKNLEWIYM